MKRLGAAGMGILKAGRRRLTHIVLLQGATPQLSAWEAQHQSGDKVRWVANGDDEGRLLTGLQLGEN